MMKQQEAQCAVCIYLQGGFVTLSMLYCPYKEDKVN
jgi:hypothetical protein